MSQYHKEVKDNLRLVDELLARNSKNERLYHEIFAIRTIYSVVAQKQVEKVHNLCFLKRIMRAFFDFFVHLCTVTDLNINAKCVILGEWHFDKSLSDKIQVPLILARKRISIKNLPLKLIDCFSIIKAICYLSGKLELKKWIITLPFLFEYYMGYRALLGDARIIITENDIFSFNYGVLRVAQQKGIVRIKIEYAIIDAILHQNCFCDYYFYPTKVHRLIRESCLYNVNLNYIEGGYLNEFKMESVSWMPPDHLTVTYFTEHGNVFEKNDIYYIDIILSLLPEDGILNVKVHPYDQISRYDKYKGNGQVKIIAANQMDNAFLISRSSVCLSIFSTMSLDSKYICPFSYFINFDVENSPYQFDYNCFRNFFDVIDSPEMLKRVLNLDYPATSLKLFRENVNMTYPDTFTVFKNFVDSFI